MNRAVVYCRVSTKEQAENLSLPTQEKACREYCDRAGVDVAEVFVDRGESAKTADRPEFQKAISRCRAGGISFFVVYNLTRFARSTYDHAIVAANLKAYGTTLRSVTEPIDDSSTGKLMESILSGFAQFDNDVRSERTKAGMRAATERGQWSHRPPLGYLTGMIPDPERAPLVRRAFELTANWPGSIADLRREVGRLGLTTRAGASIGKQSFFRLLRCALYAGIVRGPGIEAKAAFEPLVEAETFYRAQATLDGRRYAPRRRASADFPLRRFLVCGVCERRRLTGFYVRKKNGSKFGYYRCACDGVLVGKATLEAGFVELLDGIGLAAGVLKQLRETIVEEWRSARDGAAEARVRREQAVRAIRAKKSRLLDAHLAGDVASDDYREKLAEIEQALALAVAASIDAVCDESELDGALNFAVVALARPGRAWLEASPEGRAEFARLVFLTPPSWAPVRGFANLDLSPIFNDLRPSGLENEGLVALPSLPANLLGGFLPGLLSVWRATSSAGQL